MSCNYGLPMPTLPFSTILKHALNSGIFRVRMQSLWRDGRAVEGACLENRYRETYRGFEPHFLRWVLTTVYLGRCQSGRMGPPAKWLSE